MNFKIGELFCGPGGLALGAMRSSVEKNGETIRYQPRLGQRL